MQRSSPLCFTRYGASCPGLAELHGGGNNERVNQSKVGKGESLRGGMLLDLLLVQAQGLAGGEEGTGLFMHEESLERIDSQPS